MSIDGRGPSLNRAADNTIAALKSKNSRLEERVAVLEGIAQANADDRDSYAEQLAEIEGERDRARGIAVELEQQIDAIQTRIRDLHRLYDRRDVRVPASPMEAARDAIVEVENILSLVTDTVLNDLSEETS